MIKKLILALLIPCYSFAVEYICWQQADFSGVAFESAVTRCGNEKKEKGSVAGESTQDKKIVCIVPAMCLALTDELVSTLQKKTGLTSVADIKKLDSKVIQGTLFNTKYIGRPSQLTCEGTGSMSIDSFQKLAMTEAKCPNFTACANSDELFYNMSLGPPQTIQPFKHEQGTSPVRTMPNSEVKR